MTDIAHDGDEEFEGGWVGSAGGLVGTGHVGPVDGSGDIVAAAEGAGVVVMFIPVVFTVGVIVGDGVSTGGRVPPKTRNRSTSHG